MTTATVQSNLTPAMRQYHQFKEQYPEAILFFRMGDFYETFYEDAEISAKVLGIALTCRNKGTDNPVPLAGVPYHSVEKYLHTMISAGYKVAVCEQIEDAAQAKGVVKRDVVRLVTPGTLTEDALLNEKQGNHLAAITIGKHNGTSHGTLQVAPTGLAWVDLSTGQFYAQQLEYRHLIDELMRISPAECLVSDEDQETTGRLTEDLKTLVPAAVTQRSGVTFDAHQASETLTRHFNTASLTGFGFDKFDQSLCAAGAIVAYLNETQKVALPHITRLHKITHDQVLTLDQTTLRSLEIQRTLRENSRNGSLLHALDKTCTAMGARKFQQWLCYPLTDLNRIEQRQNAVDEIFQDDTLRDQLRTTLSNISDIERITSRISTGRSNPRDLLGLAQALEQLPAINNILGSCQVELLTQLAGKTDNLQKIKELILLAIDPDCGLTIREGGIIKTGYHAEVDRLRSLHQDGQTWLAGYQRKLINQTGFSNLKVGFNKVFGYYIEMSQAFQGQLPADFVRKQTLKNAERYITDELKKYEAEALTAQQRVKELEERLFHELRNQIAARTLLLQQTADSVAQIDVLASWAHLARRQNYCRPVLHRGCELEIVEGRHPVLDLMLGPQFIPNDVSLGTPHADVALITGPNMSGKSTYIRQTALITLLAHTGSFVPAASAKVGLVDRIFTRVGASDELTRGHSTFMVEMTETANIINNATERSLVILDEIGRGTSTYDGLSLAWAIAEYIGTQIKCRTLFATHYHELTELADLLPNVKNENVAVREWKDDVIFLHKINPGRTDKSYGIHVARLAGVPKTVLRRSEEILKNLENSLSRESMGRVGGGNMSTYEDGNQPTLFDLNTPPPDPVLVRFKTTDINNLTPIQAINLLLEIKNELNAR